MALRAGDTITVRRGAVIWISQYDSFKPSVSLTRTLGDEPEVERDEIDRILYVELRRAVLCEIQDRAELQPLLDVSTTRLIKHCEKVIEHGPQGQSEDFPRRKDGRKKTVKKKGRKKVARKVRRSRE